MKTHLSLTITALLLLRLSMPALAQNQPDEVKQRILTQARSMSADDYAFTRTSTSVATANGKTEKHVTVEKFDPGTKGSEQWTLVSVDGAAPDADALKRFRKDIAKRRVPGYYRLAGYFASAATVSTDSRGRTVFHFESLPKGTVIVMDTDVSQNSAADATVGEANGVPFVEQLHLTLRPMRIKLIAKLDRYELTGRYRIGPEGKPLLMEQSSDMAGSGMGMTGQAQINITYSDYRAVGRPAGVTP